MSDLSSTRSTVIPGLHYRNATEAIDWLCRVFGFHKHAIHAGPGNTVMHAELTLGGGMLMLGSARENAAAGQPISHGISLVVTDADAVYARAVAASAGILQPVQDKPQGGRGFTCRDGEGHVWHVGTYDPWAQK